MQDIKKGQIVWVQTNRGVKETVVKSIGPKYITTEYDFRIKFHKDTLYEVDGCGVGCYIILDIEKYKLDNYYDNLIAKLERIRWSKINREDLDKVAEIILKEDK